MLFNSLKLGDIGYRSCKKVKSIEWNSNTLEMICHASQVAIWKKLFCFLSILIFCSRRSVKNRKLFIFFNVHILGIQYNIIFLKLE